MQIIEIASQQQLNNFVGSQKMSQFLQSYDWAEFQAGVSGRVWRLGVLDNDELAASAVVITKELPMGKKYLYCPRGPIVAKGADMKATVGVIFSRIKDLADETGAMFLRFEPLDKLNDYEIKADDVLKKTHDVQPSKTLLLDLNKPTAELLREMQPKTRYNIKLADKKGVKFIEGGKDRFEDFWSLLDQTSDRDKFNPHGRNYYEAMIKMPDSPVKLFFAEYRGKPIATSLVSCFGDTATYLHGGSANENRNVMAPYLLQWQAIKLAKDKGLKYYDFHGIDEKKWPGVTRFKRGFGGLAVNYPGTYDLVYDSSWYSVYKMIRKVRRTF
jgi:peptidoglycan pentaglycine glycine transferase (the first glycine)